MKFIKFTLIAFIVAALAGCAAQVMNVKNATIPASANAAKVQAAIMQAGKSIGWNMTKVKPGLISASIYVRGYTAKVAIPFSAKGYNINYVGSHKLGYDKANNSINRHYNSWIKNLNGRIQHNLSMD